MCAFFFKNIRGVHYTFTALELSAGDFPNQIHLVFCRQESQQALWMDSPWPWWRLVKHTLSRLAQTTNIACSTTVQWLGWCVTSETDDTIWIRLIFFNYIHNHSYICVHFQHGPLKTLTNFPSQISGEVQWPLILTGSDVCSWKGQKAS